MSPMTVEQLRQDLPMTAEIAYFQTGTYGPASDSVLQPCAKQWRPKHATAPPPPQADWRTETGGRRPHRPGPHAQRQRGGVEHRHQHLARHAADRARPQLAAGRRIRHDFARTRQHLRPLLLPGRRTRRHGQSARSRTPQRPRTAHRTRRRPDRPHAPHLPQPRRLPQRRLLPVKEAAAIAHDAGVPVMLDLAQSVGTMPVDLQELNCDFAVGSGHKWLLGPMGTGYIFVAERRMPGFHPNFIPDRSPWTLAGDPTPPPTARSRTEIGTYNLPLSSASAAPSKSWKTSDSTTSRPASPT